MFAGVALGPVIREAIASAKLRTKNSKKKSPFKLNDKDKNGVASKKVNDSDGNDDDTDQIVDESEPTR